MNGEAESGYRTRLARQDDCEQIYNFFEELVWNITLPMVKKFVEFNHDNVYVTMKKGTDEVVATVTITPTHENQAHLGGLVVKSGYRNRGLGTELLKHVLGLHKDRIFTLIAVPGTNSFYNSKFGFKEIELIHTEAYVNVDKAKVQQALDEHNVDDIEIILYKQEMFESLNTYDTQARGYDCGYYLKVLTSVSDCMLVAFSETTRSIVGFASGVDRPALALLDGMYADNDAIALLLFRKILDTIPKTEFRIQVVKPRDLLIRFGEILPNSHTLVTMARGGNPVLMSLSKVYGIPTYDYADG